VATLRDVSRRLRDALVASDPGLLRLRLAGTATASMVAALGVMTGIARLTGQPVTAVLLGVIVSMVAAISVNDPEPGAQRLTTVLLPVPAAAAVSLGTLLAGTALWPTWCSSRSWWSRSMCGGSDRAPPR
jgi:MFS-type transporter involved in bile tolerance (Atg22 family)